jgi:hypothetical protein
MQNLIHAKARMPRTLVPHNVVLSFLDLFPFLVRERSLPFLDMYRSSPSAQEGTLLGGTGKL